MHPASRPLEATAPTDRLRARTLHGLAWVASGTVLQTLIKLVVLAVLARALTPADFGLVALSIMVGTFVLMACRVGVGPGLVQLSALSTTHVTAAIMLALPVSALMAVGLVLAAPSIADFFDQPELAALLLLQALIPLMLGISQVPESLLQRELRFKSLTLIDAVSFLLGYGVVSILLAILGFGAISVVWGLVAQEAIRTILLFAMRPVRPGFGFGMADVQSLLRFGFGLSLVQATNAAAYQLDNFVVGKLLGTQALGFYSRAYHVITMPTKLLGNSLIKVLFPAMSLIQQDHARLGNAFSRALGGVAMIAVPASVFLGVFAPEIVLLLLGDQWSAVVLPFQILSVAILFRVSHKVCEAVIRAHGSVYLLWSRQIVFALSVLAFSYVGHFFGIVGVAAGVVMACFVNSVMLLQLSRHLIDVHFWSLMGNVTRQIALGVPFFALLIGVAELLRAAGVPPVLVLAGGTVTAALLMGVPMWRAPRLFGAEGVFVSEIIGKQLHNRAKRRAGSKTSD